MSNIKRVFCLCSIFVFGGLCSDVVQGLDNSRLSLLQSAVSLGKDPSEILKSDSLDANSLLLSSGKNRSETLLNTNVQPSQQEVQENSSNSLSFSEKNDVSTSSQPTAQQKSRKKALKSESLGLSASTLPNNAGQLSEKDRYFGQHELCEREISNAEKKFGIPHRLLMAISTVESGRAVGKSKRPWPWTICANGRGYYCSTKSAAIATTKRLMARGIRNIDVGCMQVNLLHHSAAFKNLEEAFTPRSNVNYAAKFFLGLKRTYNSWTHAVGYYHSRAAKHYKPYCSLVYNTWNKVRNFQVRDTPVIAKAASEIKSNISFLPSYYSLVDNKISAKLHQLGRKTLVRSAPKFFTKKRK